MPRPLTPIAAALPAMQWGDVVLFRCNFWTAIAQRTLLRSEWDHVGVVVQTVADGLCMLEACQAGVQIFPLHKRLREYARDSAAQIGWRPLLAERTDSRTRAMSRFTEQSRGGGFSYDLAKAIRMGRCRGGAQVEVGTSYFCTELVVDFWRYCSLLSEEHPLVPWPRDFADGGDCERWFGADSASLGPTLLLDCESTHTQDWSWHTRAAFYAGS